MTLKNGAYLGPAGQLVLIDNYMWGDYKTRAAWIGTEFYLNLVPVYYLLDGYEYLGEL